MKGEKRSTQKSAESSAKKQAQARKPFHLVPETVCGVKIESLAKTWGAAKAVFYPKKVSETLEGVFPEADARLAWSVFILAAIITAAIALCTTYESVQLANFNSDTIASVTGTAIPHVSNVEIYQLVILEMILTLPLALVFVPVYEYSAYLLMKASGGKGTFKQQLYMSSIVALAIAFVNLLNFIAPLPCFPLIVAIAEIILLAYLVLYVSAKIYSRVHNIGYVHALIIVAVLTLIKLAITFLILNYIAGYLGVPSLLNNLGA